MAQVINQGAAERCPENQPTVRLRKDPAPPALLEAAARSFQHLQHAQSGPHGTALAQQWRSSFAGLQEHAELFFELHEQDPQSAARLAKALTTMPEVGTDFHGFQLLAELGQGAFGRVFLAQQGDLANRQVVLKIAADVRGEAGTLARLHHPNIVPIYSVHYAEPFHAVCMPFLGTATFQDVLRLLQWQSSLPTSGRTLVQVATDKLTRSLGKAAPVATPPGGRGAGTPGGPGPHPSGDAPGEEARTGDKISTAAMPMLTELSYVEAITWLFTDLADGLAYAHEQGIVHRDLKPANVLLTDDGRPMLLDFNVAEDTRRRAGAVVAWVAGSLPYMAPEQLAAFQANPIPLDGRSDVYSFGVMMFELLTGRYPFPACGSGREGLPEQILEDRRCSPPRLRTLNPAISPALEAIVRRCLEPSLDRRYQSARELHEDLDRQRNHRPLRHTREPLGKERLVKWARRHPSMLAVSVVALAAVLLLCVLGTIVTVRNRQLAELRTLEMERTSREQALAFWKAFQEDNKTARFLLFTRTTEPEQLTEGVRLATRLLDGYGALHEPSWQDAALVRSLPESDRRQVGEAVGELLLLLGRALVLQDGPGKPSQDVAAKALALNERAESCSDAAASPALLRQRAELTAWLGRQDEARSCRARAERLSLRSAQDHYWLASDHITGGRLREALPLLQKATYLEPDNFWAWFVLADCHERLGLEGRAEACYGACIALSPSFPWVHFNRGLAYLRQGEHALARADFDTVIRLKPDVADAFLNRALAWQGLQQYQEAEQDLTEALKRGGQATRLYFLRARIREKRGDNDGAQRDYQEGLRRPPVDEKSWLSRGYARLASSPQGALEDFEQALRLNPRSAAGLQNKAHVLAEKLGKPREALQVLNRAVELSPDSAVARAGRGVLHARLGQREPALRDAEETLLRDTSPPRLYQVACIHALTSAQHTEDRLQAFQLLSSALRKGYGFNLLESDEDLGPIRNSPEFRRLVEAARAIQAPSASAGVTPPRR
jgi:eukaryotic-like serine/threonine-protein kinase